MLQLIKKLKNVGGGKRLVLGRALLGESQPTLLWL